MQNNNHIGFKFIDFLKNDEIVNKDSIHITDNVVQFEINQDELFPLENETEAILTDEFKLHLKKSILSDFNIMTKDVEVVLVDDKIKTTVYF